VVELLEQHQHDMQRIVAQVTRRFIPGLSTFCFNAKYRNCTVIMAQEWAQHVADASLPPPATSAITSFSSSSSSSSAVFSGAAPTAKMLSASSGRVKRMLHFTSGRVPWRDEKEGQ
jgi:hypothetical protein